MAPSQQESAATEQTPLLRGRQQASANRKLYAAIAAIWLSLFLAALDGTVASTLLAPITSSFNAAEKAPWLGTSFLLSVCAFSPLYGRLSDGFGRRNALLTAMFIFTLGTAACAVAPGIDMLIYARALAGVGAGGVLTTSSIICSDLISLRKRGLFQGVTNIVSTNHAPHIVVSGRD